MAATKPLIHATPTLSPAPTTPYGANHGARSIDRVATYLLCEYTTPTPNAQSTPCTDVAIIMPGYKRACAHHVLHVLRDSLNAYQTRPQAPDATPNHTVAQTIATLDAIINAPTLVPAQLVKPVKPKRTYTRRTPATAPTAAN